ncbi:MAG: TetR/AcrR family transcriptional regulator, partial [Pollutimonas bauzanensis]
MRTKSEARRDAIMAVALEVFREVGFEAASMSQIAARVGGSKATLYNYFSSKEELLLQAMLSSADKHAHDVLQLLQTAGDFPTQLHRFVTSLLALISSPETTQVLRVAISVGGTSDIGRRFYEQGPRSVWLHIADVLRVEISKGTLRDADPDTMAMLLRSLCE